MNQNPVKITDVITTEYADFLTFCDASGKVYTSDLTNVDYVAFRASSGQTREYINLIKSKINNHVVTNSDLSNSDGPSSQYETEKDKFSPTPDESKPQTSFSGSEDNQSITNISEYTVSDTDYSNATSKVASENLVLENSSECGKTNNAVEVCESQPINDIFPNSPVITNSQYSLGNLFGVEASDFADIRIDLLNLGVRASNCLKHTGCQTLEVLLNMTIEDLGSIRNMGKTSLNRVLQAVKDYISEPSNLDYVYRKNTKAINVDIPFNQEFTSAVESLIIGSN